MTSCDCNEGSLAPFDSFCRSSSFVTNRQKNRPSIVSLSNVRNVADTKRQDHTKLVHRTRQQGVSLELFVVGDRLQVRRKMEYCKRFSRSFLEADAIVESHSHHVTEVETWLTLQSTEFDLMDDDDKKEAEEEVDLEVGAPSLATPSVDLHDVSNDPSGHVCELVLAQAEAIAVNDVVTSGSFLESSYNTETGEAISLDYSRPEFLFCRVNKASPDSRLGFRMKAGKRGSVYISHISPGSPLGRVNLKPGDRVLSINGKSVVKSSIQKAKALVDKAESDVALVVHNEGGDPSLVSSSVQKPTTQKRVGICLRNNRGAVYVSRLNDDGLFVGSLLTADQRCIQVNGTSCEALHSMGVADLIAQSKDFVTIVSRPKKDVAMVLGSHQETRWRRQALLALGTCSPTRQSLTC